MKWPGAALSRQRQPLCSPSSTLILNIKLVEKSESIPMSWLYVASGLSVVTLLAHLIGGGKSIARPVLESALEPEPKFASYYCWHMVSIIIGFMAVAFALPAASLAAIDLAWAATVLASLFTAWSIGLTIWKKQRVVTLPQWILFLPIATTGVLGVT